LVSKVDDVDWRLLLELQQNARTSYSELGRRVGLTAPAVAERVRRLEETGIIKGYRVDLDVERLGYTVTAVIRLQIPEGGCARFARIAPEFPEIHECYRVTGSDSYVLKVVLPSIRHLESLIDRLATHGTTITSIVLSTPLDHRLVEPPDARDARDARDASDVPGAPVLLGAPGPGAALGAPHAVPAVIPNGRRPAASRATR
jgi:Lrp/AsnC family transcriptional regulator, leucine-responsive regulatory protein